MTDLTPPEILAWLETLSLRERLVTLHAMSIAFPRLQRDAEWKERIGAVRAELEPDAVELGDILREAALQAERLKGEIE
jgi:hypothetical protein